MKRKEIIWACVLFALTILSATWLIFLTHRAVDQFDAKAVVSGVASAIADAEAELDKARKERKAREEKRQKDFSND